MAEEHRYWNEDNINSNPKFMSNKKLSESERESKLPKLIKMRGKD